MNESMPGITTAKRKNSSFGLVRRCRLLHNEYAAFRDNVVKFFRESVLPRTRILLDPMAGTVPLIPEIERAGVSAYFNDILPVHLYINPAKTYAIFLKIAKIQERDSTFLERELSRCLIKLRGRRLVISEKWIHDDVLDGLLFAWRKTDTYEEDLSRFFKAVILMCVRSYSCFFTSETNATWKKPGGMSSEKNLRDVVRSCLNRVFLYHHTVYPDNAHILGGRCIFLSEDAARLALDTNIDTIFTSPPYANRYDYKRMYAPELYFLSMAEANYRSINDTELLATNAVCNYTSFESDFAYLSQFKKIKGFLINIAAKARQKENQYYLRCFTRYYADLYRVVDNLLKLLSKPGRIYLVVQTNIHRGEMNEVQDYLSEYLSAKGCRVTIPHPYRELVQHQGRRNISAFHPIVIKKHYETIIEAQK